MKRYFLLRSNVESGPYIQRELKEIGLAPTDLIWVEEESTSWQHPTEISGLKNIAKAGILKPLNLPPISVSKSQPAGSDSFSTTLDRYTISVATNEAANAYTLQDKEIFSWQVRKPRISVAAIASNFFSLGVLMVGVMLFAFVIKKLVDHFEYEPHIASANAIEISSEKLPVSTSFHAAMGVHPSESTLAEMPPTNGELTPVKTVAQPPVQPAKTRVTQPVVVTENKRVELPAPGPETIVQTELKEEKQPEEKESKPAKQAPSLSISANDYKVGMFGGISDLEITVNNPSSMTINNAVVEVKFLKPNGSVVKTQTVAVENITPGSAKKVSVPASNRGVKIRYRVISSNAADGKATSDI